MASSGSKHVGFPADRGASHSFFDLDCLMSIIDEHSDYDDGFEETPHFGVCTHGTGPLDFYLVRLEDVDQARLINYWISDHVDELQPIPAPSNEFLGKVVACRRPFRATRLESLWLRGFIKEFKGDGSVLLNTLEYGVDLRVHHSMIRLLPETLANYRRLSIPSQLDNLIPAIHEPNFNNTIRREFIMMVSRNKLLEIRYEFWDRETGKWKVRLRLGEENIASMIEARWKSRLDIPKEFSSDTWNSEKLPNVTCLSRRRPPPEFHWRDEMQLENCRKVIVTDVTNPGHFYVKYVTSKTTSAVNKKLQNYYNNKNRAELYKLRGGQPLLDRYYAFKLRSSGLWEACRVTRINLEIRTCTVYAVDLDLYLDHVNFDDLLEMRIDLVTRPARSILCSLSNVVPPNNLAEWELHSIEAFKNLVFGKVFHCMISTRQEEYMSCGHPNNSLKLEVVLLGMKSSETVNIQLCGLGLAESVGPSATTMNARTSDSIPNPKNTMAHSSVKRKTRNSNIEKQEATSTKTKAKDGLNNPANPTDRYPPFYCYWLKTRHFIDGFKSKVPLGVQGRCKIIRPSACSSPGCIYVQDVYSLQNLYEMTMRLTVQAEKSPYFSYPLLTDGDFVAVQVPGQDFFYRGLVKEVYSIEKIMILLVDFGCLVQANAWRLRVLPTEYLRVPAFASRVYLDVIPESDLFAWPSTACSAAVRFIQERSDDYLWYLYLTQAETLAFEEYEQALVFDHEEKRWLKGPPQQLSEDLQINFMKEHPLLKKLYLAVGGHIFCQSTKPVISFHRPAFQIKKMSTDLKLCGYLPQTSH